MAATSSNVFAANKNKLYRDFVSGYSGGALAILCSQPIDTLRVRLQQSGRWGAVPSGCPMPHQRPHADAWHEDTSACCGSNRGKGGHSPS